MWGPFLPAVPHDCWETKVGELPWLMFPTPLAQTPKKQEDKQRPWKLGHHSTGLAAGAQLCTGACLDVSTTSVHCRLILEVAATPFLPQEAALPWAWFAWARQSFFLLGSGSSAEWRLPCWSYLAGRFPSGQPHSWAHLLLLSLWAAEP